MERKKINFFKRVKNAVTNFDEYKNFSEEKVSTAIKYLLKITLIFTIIVTIALSIKLIDETNKAINIFETEFPEFKFENNVLIMDEDNSQYIKGDESGFFEIIIDSNKDEIDDIEETNNYQMVVAALKNKIVIKNVNNIQSTITYEQISQKYDLTNLNKQSVIEVTSSNLMIKVYIIVIAISLVYLYIAYFIQILMDVLFLSLIGFILSRIIGIRFNYKSIFSMSIYALTLSILLYLIYIVVNLFTGFNIVYFDVAYDAIAYIYIITAMLMIKSDLIKQQIEVGQIIEEQRKIREEKQEENQEKEEKKKQDKEKKEDKKENNKEEGTPEGSKA